MDSWSQSSGFKQTPTFIRTTADFRIRERSQTAQGRQWHLKKSACVLSDRSCQEKYTVIQDLDVNEVTVSSACKCLGVSTSGYYAWRKCQANLAQKYNDLKAVYWQHHARLGAPSLVHDMHDLGYSMSERTVGRMLKKLGLRSRIARKYKHTTDSNHRLPTAPNLLDRQFGVGQLKATSSF